MSSVSASFETFGISASSSGSTAKAFLGLTAPARLHVFRIPDIRRPAFRISGP